MTDIINRTGAEALIPDEVSKDIIQGAVAASSVLTRFRKLPNMSSKTRTQPVLDMLPLAYFVDGDTGMKQTTRMAWDNKRIVAEEIAVIVPIPESVLADAEDSGYDVWGEIKPRIVEAFGGVIDKAVLFGVGKPAGWRESLWDSIVKSGTMVHASNDLYADILSKGGVFSKVEECGYDVNGVISGVALKADLRDLRGSDGHPIFKDSVQGATTYALDGTPISFNRNGTWDNKKAKLIAGDFSQAVYAIRQDITYKILTEGVIQDPNTKEILYNLAQQDMVALRCVMRLGWELPNPINAENADNENRLPFAALIPAVAHNVTVTTPTNGTVTADKATAKVGEIVSLTVSPSPNYKVGTIKVNDTAITAKNGKYTFIMPDEDVTVTATFVGA